MDCIFGVGCWNVVFVCGLGIWDIDVVFGCEVNFFVCYSGVGDVYDSYIVMIVWSCN